MLMNKELICRLSAVAMAVVAMMSASAREIAIVERDGANPCTIVVRRDAGACEKYAAQELKRYLGRITGADLAIADDSSTLPERAILIGRTSFTDAIAGATDYGALGPDGFRLKASGGRLLVVADPLGQPGAGVLYGVYELLERFGGCGWYASWHEVVPENGAFAVPEDLDETQRPAFDLRHLDWYDMNRNPVNGYRNKMNPPNADPKFGGSRHNFCPGLGNCHTFETLLSPAEYFEAHPEYFCEVNGERRPSQPCLSNPDVLRVCIEKVRAKLAEYYPKGVRLYGVSQNDGNNDYCRCKDCKALDEAEGTPAASIIRFVNAIAEDIETDYPEAIVETLAYDYSSTPPRTLKPRHNVMPCVCTLRCDFSKSLATSRYAKNVSTMKELRKWGKMTKHFYLWDYTTDFSSYMYVYPNVRALRENVRTYRDVGVTMLYPLGAWNGLHGDWGELKAWLLAKYLWNPDRDEEALLGEFFERFYGPASAVMRRSFDELHALRRDEVSHPLKVFDGISPEVVPDAFLDRQAKLMDEAEKLAAGTVYARNVAYQRMSSDFTRVMRYLSSSDYGVLFCSRHPERVNPVKHAEMVGAANRVLAVIDEPNMPPTYLTEGYDDGLCRQLRTFVTTTAPTCAVDRVIIEDSYLGVGGPPSGYSSYVNDDKTKDGRAVHYTNVSYTWHGKFNFSTIMMDADVVYKLYVRLRVDVRPEASAGDEVFWTGVYNDATGAAMKNFSLKAGDVKDGEYHWYEVGEFTPKAGDYLWSGGGRFSGSHAAHNGCWIDCYLLAREDAGIYAHDSFEDYAMDADASSVVGWQGDGTIEILSYSPPIPPGFPMTKVPHTKVMNAYGEVARMLPREMGEYGKVDLMVCVSNLIRQGRMYSVGLPAT